MQNQKSRSQENVPSLTVCDSTLPFAAYGSDAPADAVLVHNATMDSVCGGGDRYYINFASATAGPPPDVNWGCYGLATHPRCVSASATDDNVCYIHRNGGSFKRRVIARCFCKEVGVRFGRGVVCPPAPLPPPRHTDVHHSVVHRKLTHVHALARAGPSSSACAHMRMCAASEVFGPRCAALWCVSRRQKLTELIKKKGVFKGAQEMIRGEEKDVCRQFALNYFLSKVLLVVAALSVVFINTVLKVVPYALTCPMLCSVVSLSLSTALPISCGRVAIR